MYRHRKFLMKVHERILEGKVTAHEVARQSGKKYETFMRELNPFDDKAKVGVTTYADMIRATKDERLVDLLLEESDMTDSYTAPKDRK